MVGEDNTSFHDRMEEGNSQYEDSCLKNCESIMRPNHQEEEGEEENKEKRMDVWV